MGIIKVSYPIAKAGPLRIIAAQVDSTPAATKEKQIENLGRHLSMVQCQQPGVNMLILPELSTLGLAEIQSMAFLLDCQKGLAEPPTGETFKAIRAAAWKQHFLLGAGLPFEESDAIYNAYTITIPNADQQVLICRKRNTVPPFSPGPGYLRFTHNQLNIGVIIGNDIFDARVRNRIRLNSLDLLIIPSYMESIEHLDGLLRNSNSRLCILTVNYAGFSGSTTFHFPGQNPVSGLGMEEGLLEVVL